MKILAILTTKHPAIEFYRSWGVFPHMVKLANEMGGENLMIKFKNLSNDDFGGISPGELYDCDVVFMDRVHTDDQLKLLKHIKLHINRKLWLDYDDDLFTLDRGNPAFIYYHSRNVGDNIQQALQLADLVTVSTPPLQQIYSSMNANVHVVPNAWNDKQLPLQEPKRLRKKRLIAWRGSNAHLVDLMTVQKFFNTMVAKKQDIIFFGDCPPFITPGFKFAEYKNIFQHFAQFRNMQPDFLIIPLAKTKFNQGKSNIAYIEATAAGVLCFAPIGLKEFNRPGVIHYESNDDLIRKVEKMTNTNKQNNISIAQKYIQNELAIDVITIKRLSLFHQLFE